MNQVVIGLVVTSLLVTLTSADGTSWLQERASHGYRNLSQQQVLRVANLHDMTMFNDILDHIMVERVSGSPGIRAVRDYIVDQLQGLGWKVDLDSFDDSTPLGTKNFVNIIAVQNPNANRWLTLVCHYDSKYMPNEHFVAATDSAVPCAMMLHLAHKLNTRLAAKQSDISLQLLFLDGEEAFVRWTNKDSLYGARHLAQLWQDTLYPLGNTAGTNTLHRIDMFLLLDLIGAQNPRFHNWFAATSQHYQHIADTERKVNTLQQRLMKKGENTEIMKPYQQNYFSRSLYHGEPYIQDDHIPFLNRGVPVVHMISAPFPPQWHTERDNKANLDMDTIRNINVILRVYVSEYLGLDWRKNVGGA